MNKFNLILVQHLIPYILLSLIVSNQATPTFVQNPKLANVSDGLLELKPNGTLLLRSTLNNSSNIWQETLILKAILYAIRSIPLRAKDTIKDLNEKMYGEGDEHKFPPFLERVIQRIQTYFSVYKYMDTSQPMRQDFQTSSTAMTGIEMASTPSITSDISNATLNLDHANEIDVSLSNDSYYGFNRKPLQTSTSSITEKSTMSYDAEEDKENEFIEIKDEKTLQNNTLSQDVNARV